MNDKIEKAVALAGLSVYKTFKLMVEEIMSDLNNRLQHAAKDPAAGYFGTLCGFAFDRIAALEAEVARYEGAEVVSAQFLDSTGKWCPFINAKHQSDTIDSGEWDIRYLIIKPAKEG